MAEYKGIKVLWTSDWAHGGHGLQACTLLCHVDNWVPLAAAAHGWGTHPKMHVLWMHMLESKPWAKFCQEQAGAMPP